MTVYCVQYYANKVGDAASMCYRQGREVIKAHLVLTAGTLVGGDAVAATQVLGELGLFSIVGVGAPLTCMAVDS